MTPDKIKQAVASVMCVSVQDIHDRIRTKKVSIARRIAMYLTYRLCDLTMEQIAEIFDRHHASISHSVDIVTHWKEHDWEIKDILSKVESALEIKETQCT